MDPQLFEQLREMRSEATERHIEVVQRLTALESTKTPIDKIEKRLKSLEGWRNKIAGFVVAANMFWVAVAAWIETRAK